MKDVRITCSQQVHYHRAGKISEEELGSIADALTGGCKNVLQPQDVGCDEITHCSHGDPLELDDVEIYVDGEWLDDEALKKLAREHRKRQEEG